MATTTKRTQDTSLYPVLARIAAATADLADKSTRWIRADQCLGGIAINRYLSVQRYNSDKNLLTVTVSGADRRVREYTIEGPKRPIEKRIAALASKLTKEGEIRRRVVTRKQKLGKLNLGSLQEWLGGLGYERRVDSDGHKGFTFTHGTYASQVTDVAGHKVDVSMNSGRIGLKTHALKNLTRDQAARILAIVAETPKTAKES